MSEVSLLVSVLAICVLCASAASWLLHLLAGPMAGVLKRWPAQSSAIDAGLVLAPAVVWALGFAALLWPAPWAGCHCETHGVHHPHLCTAHPLLATPLLLPACFVVVPWLVVATARLRRLGAELVAASRWVEHLRGLPRAQVDGVTVHLREGGSLDAFTIGALTPVIVIDRALWTMLSTDERRAVVQHERAHAERRDGLTLAVLRIGCALSPWTGGERLIEIWRSASEAACDRFAAAALGDACTVARALVTIERARSLLRSQGASFEPAPALSMAAGERLERRVRDLLEEPALRGPPALRNDAAWVVAVSLAAGLFTIALPGGTFHHAVETVIGTLFH